MTTALARILIFFLLLCLFAAAAGLGILQWFDFIIIICAFLLLQKRPIPTMIGWVSVFGLFLELVSSTLPGVQFVSAFLGALLVIALGRVFSSFRRSVAMTLQIVCGALFYRICQIIIVAAASLDNQSFWQLASSLILMPQLFVSGLVDLSLAGFAFWLYRRFVSSMRVRFFLP